MGISSDGMFRMLVNNGFGVNIQGPTNGIMITNNIITGSSTTFFLGNSNSRSLEITRVITNGAGESWNTFIVGRVADRTAPVCSVFTTNSKVQGSLPFPRVTSTERINIATPVEGLHVYQTDGTEGVYVYKSTGWQFAY
jgi:hypothetical protein